MKVHIPVDEFLEEQNNKSRVINTSKKFDYMVSQNKSCGTISKSKEVDMEEKLTAHDYELKEIRNILGNVAENQKETNSQVSKLAESMVKLDLYLEKQNNIESKHNDSITRLHKRFDDVDIHIKGFYDTRNDYNLSKKDISDGDKRITKLENDRNKIGWGIVTAVGMAILGLVIK